MLPFCHFLSLISQLVLNTGRLLAGLVTQPNTPALPASGVGWEIACLQTGIHRYTLGSVRGGYYPPR